MKTLKFLTSFRDYTPGQVITFDTDERANAILSVAGVAEVVDLSKSTDKPKKHYQDKMMHSA